MPDRKPIRYNKNQPIERQMEDMHRNIQFLFENQEKIHDVFNVGSSEKNKVNEIASLVGRNMKLKPKFKYTGGTRGWTGDVKLMLLDTKKIESLGWTQRVSLQEGIKKYIKWLKKKG